MGQRAYDRDPGSTKEKDLIEIAGVQRITLLEMQECNKYLYVLIRPVDSNTIVRSLSSMIGPQECVGKLEIRKRSREYR